MKKSINNPFKKSFNNFILDEDGQVIFAFVPKVACTNWKVIFRYLYGYENYLDTSFAHSETQSGLRFLDLRTPDVDFVFDPAIKKYAVVRDPYSRALSAYINKVEIYNDPHDRPEYIADDFMEVYHEIERFRLHRLDEEAHPEISFEVFLLWLRNGASEFCDNPHWAPQAELLHAPDVKFDFIGRFETLQADARKILAAIGCDIPFPSQAEIGFNPTRAAAKMARYYDPRCYALARGIYARDFEAFGEAADPRAPDPYAPDPYAGESAHVRNAASRA